jgi:hypothetical protein
MFEVGVMFDQFPPRDAIPEFWSFVEGLGNTWKERASRFRVSSRSLSRWSTGEDAPRTTNLMNVPASLRVLADVADRLIRDENAPV